MPTRDDYADVTRLDHLAPDRYDNSRWHAKESQYQEWWKYYSGEVLEDEDQHSVETDGGKPLRYPLKLNLVQMTALVHASGIVGDTSGMDTPVGLVAKPRDDRGGESVAEDATRIVSDYLEESGLESTIDEAALSCAVFGGAVYKTAFDSNSPMGVRLEPRWVENFRPVWYPTDRNRLAEVFCTHVCDIAQAEAAYHVKISQAKMEAQRVLVVEHWTEKDYRVTVNGEIAKYEDGTKMAGKNPFGFVPFVYLPSYRMGSFYGESVVEGLMGLQDEINLRVADLGDAVAGAIHRMVWVRNRHKGSQGLKFDSYSIWNLGTNPPGYDPPEVGVLEPPKIPTGAIEFINELMELLGRVAHTPPVVYGLDEGSQRSALTLAFRMYPYLAMIERYRRSMAWGWKQAGWQALKMMEAKGLNSVTEEHTHQLWRVEFAPIMPRDREQLINETILLVQTMLRSPEKALELLADIPKEEITAEIERIIAFQKLRSEFASQGEMQQEPEMDVEVPIATSMGE